MNNQSDSWQNLMSKLTPHVSDKGPQSDSNLLLSQVTGGAAPSQQPNSQIKESKSQGNDQNKANKDDTIADIKKEQAKPASRTGNENSNYLDLDYELPDIQKEGQEKLKTIATCQDFIAYINKKNSLCIRNLCQLTSSHVLPDISSPICDFQFYSAEKQIMLAVLLQNSKVIVFSIQYSSEVQSSLQSSYTLESEGQIEQGQLQWKDSTKLGVSAHKSFFIIDLTINENAVRPLKFEKRIIEYSLSKKYSIAYILFEDNTVRISNLDGYKLREFLPHKETHTQKVLFCRNVAKVESSNNKNKLEVNDQYEYALKDIFVTISKDLEIKVWDLSEQNLTDSYYCIETFQIDRMNDKLSPIKLIRDFAFFNEDRTILFLSFLREIDQKIDIYSLHINKKFYAYDENYNTTKKEEKFFDSCECTTINNQTSFCEIATMQLHNSKISQLFRKSQKKGQDDNIEGSPANQSYVFFLRGSQGVKLKSVPLESINPLSIFEDGSNKSQFPPEFSGTLKEIYDSQKKNDKPAEPTNSSPKEKQQSSSKGQQQSSNTSEKRSTQQPNQPTKIVTRENRKEQQQAQKVVAEEQAKQVSDSQPMAFNGSNMSDFENSLNDKFTLLINRSGNILESKMNNLEKVIESKIAEKVEKMKQDSILESINKNIQENIKREFSNQFEKVVTPSFERYLVKMFEQISKTFEQGQKFYVDKLTLEQQKNNQIKDTLNDVIKTFVTISTSLTESILSNQQNFNKIDSNISDKQNHIMRLIEQMNEILSKQQDLQKKIESSERSMAELSLNYKEELEKLKESTNQHLDRLNENFRGRQGLNIDLTSSQTNLPVFGSNQQDKDESKKDGSGSNNNQYMYQAQHGHQQGYGGTSGPYYGSNRNQKSNALSEQLPYLLSFMSGKPMDSSIGNMGGHRGYHHHPGMMSPGSSQLMNYNQFGPQYNPYMRNQYGAGGGGAHMYPNQFGAGGGNNQNMEIQFMKQRLEQLQNMVKTDKNDQQGGGESSNTQQQNSNQGVGLNIQQLQSEPNRKPTEQLTPGGGDKGDQIKDNVSDPGSNQVNQNNAGNNNNYQQSSPSNPQQQRNAHSLTNLPGTDEHQAKQMHMYGNFHHQDDGQGNMMNMNYQHHNMPTLHSQPSFGLMNNGQNYGGGGGGGSGGGGGMHGGYGQGHHQYQQMHGNQYNQQNPAHFYMQQNNMQMQQQQQQGNYYGNNSPNQVPQQMMNAQVNKQNQQTKPREGADFYQIPLVSSMVKESNNNGGSGNTNNVNIPETSSDKGNEAGGGNPANYNSNNSDNQGGNSN